MATTLSGLTERVNSTERKLEDVCDDTKNLNLKVNTAEGTIASHDNALKSMKESDSKRNYWLSSAIIVVAGAVAGWLTMMATMKANVDALTTDQLRIHEELKGIRSATYQQTARVQKVGEAVQDVATEVKNGKSDGPTVAEWYNALPQKEQNLLKRRGILPFPEVVPETGVPTPDSSD